MRLISKTLANRFNFYTIIAVYFLILVGGIVRSTGAGMGCPDWPKCFGSYIPPVDATNLPADYEDIYVQSRVKKNQRLATTLTSLGFVDLAEKVSTDPLTFEKTSYNAEKAWIEYVNRLIGVAIGLFVIFNMVTSFACAKRSKLIPLLGVSSFVLVVFQGWVGSLVVSTNLLPGFITFHMILALVLVGLLLVQRFKMIGSHGTVYGRWLVTVLLFLFTLQIIFGTQVREQIDSIHASGIVKSEWISNLGTLFYIHRSYSIVLMVLIGWLMYKNYRERIKNTGLIALGGIVVLEILLGMILAYFAVPAFAQPLHLFLGTVAYGVLFYLFLQSNFKKSVA